MPLLFDMKLPELTSYQGTNPRPDDFDDYWDAALAELASVDPEVELVPSEFQAPYAECFPLYFTGNARARVHPKLLPFRAQEGPPGRLMSMAMRNGRRLASSWPTAAAASRFPRRLPQPGAPKM